MGGEVADLSFPPGFKVLISGYPVCQSPLKHHGQQGNDWLGLGSAPL